MIERWTHQSDKPFLRRGLTLCDVSQMTGLGKHRLSAYLNDFLGKNFCSWITELRMREVERLLVDWSYMKTLSEIADQTGFADLAAMSKAFRKIKGFSPSAYRKMMAARIHK